MLTRTALLCLCIFATTSALGVVSRKQFNGECVDDDLGLSDITGVNCTELQSLTNVACSPFIAAYCRQTCQVCERACVDNNELIEVLHPAGTTGGCTSNIAGCTDAVNAPFYKLFCPVTCGECAPTPTPTPEAFVCRDDVEGLLEVTLDPSFTCDTVSTFSLCDDGFFGAYCAESCAECFSDCVDNDARIVDLRIANVTSCSAVKAQNRCNMALFSNMFNLYCPESCNACGEDGRFRTSTPLPTPVPSTSPSPSPSPAVPASPLPNNNNGGADSDNSTIVFGALIGVSCVLLYGAWVMRKRTKHGLTKRGRVYPANDDRSNDDHSDDF